MYVLLVFNETWDNWGDTNIDATSSTLESKNCIKEYSSDSFESSKIIFVGKVNICNNQSNQIGGLDSNLFKSS